MSRTFYLRLGDEVSGPVTTQQLRQMVANGTLRKTDYVRAADQDKWYVASGVKGLFPDSASGFSVAQRHVAPLPERSVTPTAPRIETVFDIEAYELGRKRRLVARRKRLMLWAGATAGIVIISLVVALPLIRSAGGLENATEDRSRSNTVRSPAPDEEEGSPKVSASDAERETAKPTGLGWSLADVQRRWGDKDGWDWYHRQPALSGEPGVIDYRAKHADGRTEQIQVVGIPDNLRCFQVLSTIKPLEDASDPKKLAAWSLRATAMSAEVAGADPYVVAEWFITVFWQFIGRVTEHHDIVHGESRKFGQIQLDVMFILLKTGSMSTVGVSPLDEASNIEPLPTEMSAPTDEPAPAFAYANVSSRREEYGGFRIIGEITNNSGRSFQIASFTLSVYDSNGRLVDTAPIVISNFAAGRTKSFDAHVETLPEGWEFKIDFENGIE